MRLQLSDNELKLRDDVRAFLSSNCPSPSDLPEALEELVPRLQEWQEAAYEAGFVGRSWPTEYGGGGHPTVEEVIVNQEFAAAGAPELAGAIGLSVLGPALLTFSNDEQKRRFVEPLLSGREIWCQGFSEPEAGSDLASLRTTAVDTGDAYVLNGQKTWCTFAQFATWGGVLARTDPDVAKHRGISMLILDMRSPGVEVRPMEQITGHAEFSELFFTDVVVPKERLLGQPGDGWKIAMHVVSSERGTAALPHQATLRARFNRLVEDVRRTERDGRSLIDDVEVQRALARALIDIEVLRHHALRTMSPFLSGKQVGPESSGVKQMLTRAEQTLSSTAIEVLGDGMSAGFWQERYLYSRATSVFGGSREIQRNIIADRVLSLPNE